jgi:hypothetical protein
MPRSLTSRRRGSTEAHAFTSPLVREPRRPAEPSSDALAAHQQQRRLVIASLLLRPEPDLPAHLG